MTNKKETSCPQRKNPFTPIYQVMNQIPGHEKYNSLPPFPRLLDIELTNHCNMRCLFCGNRAQSRKKGFMDFNTFQKILKEVSAWKTPLRFIRWGENLLHPEALKWFRLAKKEGLTIHLTTNGSLLDSRFCKELIAMELDSIKISFQGAGEKRYAEMRNNNLYHTVLGNLRELHQLRGDREKPFIHVSSTMTDETPEEIEKFKATIAPYTDTIIIGKTDLGRYNIFEMNFNEEEFNRFISLKKKESINRRHHTECPEVFDKLSINWDGTVSACCGDYDKLFVVGDLEKQSLEDIWKGEQMEEIRRILLRHDHDKLSLCRFCYAPFDNRPKIKTSNKR